MTSDEIFKSIMYFCIACFAALGATLTVSFGWILTGVAVAVSGIYFFSKADMYHNPDNIFDILKKSVISALIGIGTMFIVVIMFLLSLLK